MIAWLKSKATDIRQGLCSHAYDHRYMLNPYQRLFGYRPTQFDRLGKITDLGGFEGYTIHWGLVAKCNKCQKVSCAEDIDLPTVLPQSYR